RLIGGAKAEIDMPVTGIKPIPMHAFWPVGVTTAVIAGRVRDRLGI
ncbi:FAD-dependent oxidoreductase, partial [Bradyrhizobium sp. PRIMUS42]|nr:FAD-dependent oxidoreductase [Bradyrhizobium sp. PRIMUS42]